MVRKIKKTAAALLAALTCLPLAACGTSTTEEVVKSAAGESVLPIVETVGESGATEQAENRVGEISVWTGSLSDAGWNDPSTAGGNTYDGFAVDDAAKTATISSADALAYFAHEVYARGDGFADYTVTLECDVDLNNRLWIPIGFDHRKQAGKSLPHAFKGTFDGNGHTIYNFSAEKFLNAITSTGTTESAYKYAIEADGVSVELYSAYDNSNNDATFHFYEFHYGFFGATGNATVKNLNIDTFNFNYKDIWDEAADGSAKKLLLPDSVAALIGFAGGQITVENCTVGNPDADSWIVGADTASGLIGRAYSGVDGNAFGTSGNKMPVIIEDCTSYVNLGCKDESVTSDGNKKGGILAYAYWIDEIQLINCKNYGDIYGTYIGGMISYTQDGGVRMTFDGCENYGNLYQYVQIIGGVTSGFGGVSHYAGGIAGRLYSHSPSPVSFSMTDCINYGNIVCDTAYAAGGICGKLYMNANSATVKNVIKGCFNYGDITVNNATVKDAGGKDVSSICGGAIGELTFNDAKSVVGVGNVGKVAGGGTVNGCVGTSSGKFTTLYLINGYEL